MRKEDRLIMIKNTPKIVDYMLDETVTVDSRIKLRKRLEEVCNLATQALEQEPKIEPIAEIKFDDDMLHEIVEEAVKNIEIEPKWIPVSEIFPEDGSEVLVCYDFKGKRSVYIADFYGDGDFHGLDDEYLTSECRKYRKAVAWMPLPEPYQPERSGKE